MLRNIILIILFLIFSVWIGVKLGQDPGVAAFAWHGNLIEMPLWFAAVCLLFGIFVVWQLSHLGSALHQALYRLKNWRHWRAHYKACSKTGEGLLDLLEARWQKAERHLGDHATLKGLAPINYLGAAYAAHQQGAIERRDAWLRQVENIPASKLLQADFALSDGKPAKAVAILKPLRPNPAILRRLQKALRRENAWENLFNLIPTLRKAGNLSREKADRLESKYARKWLATPNTPDTLQTIWRRFPRHLQQNPRLVRTYATQLMHHKETLQIASQLISSILSRNFDSKLVRLYGQLELPDPQKQLLQAEKWLKTHPHDPALLLMLGQLALRCRLWGKARAYLNDCLEQNPKEPNAYAALGLLDEQSGNRQKEFFQNNH